MLSGRQSARVAQPVASARGARTFFVSSPVVLGALILVGPLGRPLRFLTGWPSVASTTTPSSAGRLLSPVEVSSAAAAAAIPDGYSAAVVEEGQEEKDGAIAVAVAATAVPAAL
jgi:hypothetical protein|eukprot:COSAG01_NODE_403_length_17482_cov_77.249597_3_plen_114_part_00